MTSASNRLLPLLSPTRFPVIGTLRPPQPSDLRDRRVPGTRTPLQLPPSPTREAAVAIHRSSLEFETAWLRVSQQARIDVRSDFSCIRQPPVPVVDPEADSADVIEEALGEVLGDEEEEMVEDRFIAKVRGVRVEEVRRARGKRGFGPMQRFVLKVKAVGARGPVVVAPAPAPAPASASASAQAPAGARVGARAGARSGTRAGTRASAAQVPALPQAPSRSAPVLTNAQPASTILMTDAEAALALTNDQEGTQVLMEELRAGGDINDLDDSADMYNWIVGSVGTREMTVAEAALAVTNMRSGTSVTMEDLRTARELVDLWDCEDTFVWTVGNVD